MLKINSTYYVTQNSFASLRTCRIGTALLWQTRHRQRCLEMADEGDKKQSSPLRKSVQVRLRINSVVFSPRHSGNKFPLCSRLDENVRFFATVVFSPRHSGNKFPLCSRLDENVQKVGKSVFLHPGRSNFQRSGMAGIMKSFKVVSINSTYEDNEK